jgi:hypothetical protein
VLRIQLGTQAKDNSFNLLVLRIQLGTQAKDR